MENITKQPELGSNDFFGHTLWYYIALEGILAIVTMVGNGFVVFLISTRRSLKVNTNYFILSLAVSDLFVGFCLPTFSLSCALWIPCTWDVFYKFFNLFTTVSVANLVVMTLDRLLAINWPLWYSTRMTSKWMTNAIAAAWVVPSIIAMLPFAWMYSVDVETRRKVRDVYYLCTLVIFELLPAVAMPLVYARIFWVVRRHWRQVRLQRDQLSYNSQFSHPEHIPSSQLKRRITSRWRGSLSREREWSATAALGVVILLFVLCWAYDIYITLCTRVSDVCEVRFDIAEGLSNLLIYLNSCINPFVYFFLKKDVKREVKACFSWS